MTESPIADLATAISARREADDRDATWLLSLAARLEECDPPLGLDLEIAGLKARAHRLRTSIDSVSERADELLQETQRMDLGKLAEMNASPQWLQPATNSEVLAYPSDELRMLCGEMAGDAGDAHLCRTITEHTHWRARIAAHLGLVDPT